MNYKKIITFLLIFTFVFNLASCNKEEQKVEKYYKTTKVSSWSINLEDNYVWYVESEKKTQIWAKWWWLIKTIYVEEWDYVNAWDIIAKIDSSESDVAISNQEVMLQEMQELKNAVGKSFDSQIDVTKSLENQININLNWANSILELSKNIKDKELSWILSEIETTKNSLETTKVELEQTRLVLDTKEKNLYSNGKNSITNSMIVDTNTIKYVDELLWVINPENDDKNDSFWDFLWARDTIQKSEVVNEFKNINSSFLEYKKIYEDKILNKDPSKEEIELVLKEWIDFNNNLRNFLKNLYETVDNSVTNVPNFSDSVISSHKDKISNFWKDIESALVTISWDYVLWLKWISESIDNFKSEREKSLSLLEKKVELANNNLTTISKKYEQALEWHNLKITDIETKTKEAEEKLNEISKNKTSIENSKTAKISELNIETSKINLNKDLSLVSINNSIIRSPISWVVTKKFVEIWWVIVLSMPIIEISDTSNIKVSFEVKDDVLAKINVWSKINVKVDSVDELQKWFIGKIYPTKNEITKKTKIEVKLDEIKSIKIWDTAKLYFSENSENWIFIPNKTIIENYMIPWVYVVRNNKCVNCNPEFDSGSINKNNSFDNSISSTEWQNTKLIEFKQIKILKQNADFSLIEWLNIWDEIISDWKENLFDWEILE